MGVEYRSQRKPLNPHPRPGDPPSPPRRPGVAGDGQGTSPGRPHRPPAPPGTTRAPPGAPNMAISPRPAPVGARVWGVGRGDRPECAGGPQGALVWRVRTVIRVSHSTHRPYRASRPPWAAVLSGVCGPTKSRPAEGTKRDIADVLITKCPFAPAHETPSTPNPRIWPSALRWSAQHPPIEETHDSRTANRQNRHRRPLDRPLRAVLAAPKAYGSVPDP